MVVKNIYLVSHVPFPSTGIKLMFVEAKCPVFSSPESHLSISVILLLRRKVRCDCF